MIAAAERALSLAGPNTRIIPGHGPLAGRDELEAFRDLLVAVRANVSELIAEGKGRDAVIAAKPTAEFDAEWGDGFLQPDVWVGIVYNSMTASE